MPTTSAPRRGPAWPTSNSAFRFADTVMRYASVSKHFLCALVAGSTISLNDPLGEHLALPPTLAAVAVGRALDMTGGLPDTMETLWLLGVPPTTGLDRHELLRFATSFEALNFAPGTEVSYFKTGYRLVQAALEAKRSDVRTALRDRLFGPLDLAIDMPDDEAEPVENLATGYWMGPTGWIRGRYGLHLSASGGLVGSALDLVAWIQALQADRGPTDGLLPWLAGLRYLADGRPTAYGLGLARHMLGERVLLGHGGSLPGYKTQFLLDRLTGAGVVVLSNREETDAGSVALRVMAGLFGRELSPPAAGTLPKGLFATAEGPFWLEHEGGRITYLGAQETLYEVGEGWAASRSAHLPIRLRMAGGGIEGEVGHVARYFRPVPADAAPSPAWAGTWICPAQYSRFDITVSNSHARMHIGSGPLHTVLDLLPLDSSRALTDRSGDGPWRQRGCLHFNGDTVRLATNRSRILTFRREAAHAA
jgi:hypothetical protein